MKFLGLAALCGIGLSALAADNVAKVGTQEYPTIDEAVEVWKATNKSTLTLLADVTLPDVVKFPSTTTHTLNLSTFTLTAASGKNAIEITKNGLTSAGTCLTIDADASNPGGIDAGSNYCIYYSNSSGKDRPIIAINNGVFRGAPPIWVKSPGNTNAPQLTFKKGRFISTGLYGIYSNRALTQVNGGDFSGGSLGFYISADSSAYCRISGGTFDRVPATMDGTPTDQKFWYGTTRSTVGSTYVPVYDAKTYFNLDKRFVVTTGDVPEYGATLEKPTSGTLVNSAGPVYYQVASQAIGDWDYTRQLTLFVDESQAKSLTTSKTSTMALENGAKYTGTITLGTSAKLVVKGGISGFVGKVVCSNADYFAKKSDEGDQYTYSCITKSACPVKITDPSGAESYFVEPDEANAAIAAAASGSTIEFRDGTYTATKTLGAGETLTLVFAGGAYDYECLVKGAAGYRVDFDVNGSTVVATAVHDESKAQASTEGEGGQKQSYDTVKEAVEQAASGATVKLNPEATKESAPIEVGGEGKQTAIDLNGGGIEAAPTGGDAAVKVAGGAKLVIGDSSADGKGVVSAGDPEKTVVKVETGSKATIEGGTYVGKLEVADGAELVIKDGTFTDNPSEFIDPELKAQGQTAKLSEDHSVWTVGEGEIKASAELPATGAVTDKQGKAVEQPTPQQESAILEVKQEVVAAVTTDDAVAGATTGINDVTKDENGNLKPAILESIKDQAAGQPGVDEEVIEKIGESGVSSNFLNIAVKTVDVVVDGTAAKPATVVYEVTPKIETTVIKDDGTKVKVTTTVPNDEVAKRPMSFNLKVTDPTAQIAFVRHTGEGFAPDDFTCKVWEKDGKRYITVTVSHFSSFGVSYSSEVVVDSEETIGIVKVEKPEAGEVAFGVPFVKSAGANATFGELLVAGAASGDRIRTFASAQGGYAATAATAEAVPGTAFWYDRAAASSVPLAVGGLVKDGLGATGATGAPGAPKMTLFMNPYRDTVDVTTVIDMKHEGDEIAVEGGKVRYLWNGSAWTVKATDETVATIPVPAGKTFWYVSKSGEPRVAW